MDTIVKEDAETPDAARHSRVLTLADGRQLGYAEYGDPHGLPLLALHGTPGSRFMFALGDGPARARGLRIIAPDRAGYALTVFRPSASLLETTDDLRALADALGLDRFAVSGISGGGPHAVAAASAMPERVLLLALVSPCGPIADHAGEIGMTALNKLIFNQIGPSPKASSAFFWALRNLVLWSPEAAYRTLLQHVTSMDADVLSRPEVKANLQATFQEGLRPGIAGAQQDLSLFCVAWGFPLEAIDVPALLWQGSADTVVPPDAAYHLARRLPNCRLHVIPAAGHYWGFGQFDTILDAVATALRSA
jgi:pimeloyl-ACP methyl ester carboxylesterase